MDRRFQSRPEAVIMRRSGAVRSPFTWFSAAGYLTSVPSTVMQKRRATSPTTTSGVFRRRLLTGLALTVALGVAAGACGGNGGSDSSSAGSSSGDVSATKANTAATQAEVSAVLASSGATFPKPFYEEAITAFKDVQPKITQAYGAGGSGKGRQDLADQLVDWAGSDGLVKDEDRAKFKGGDFLYFPTVSAPITVSYNVRGLDKLQLSPDTIARIFQRQITVWNDPAIAADNPGAKLPATDITVAHRSDGSGTTENFTKFLAAAAPAVWTLKSGSTVEWPADSQAGNGNAGVASIVKGTDGAVGYVDLSDAKATGLAFASVKNKAGKYVEPTLKSTEAALAGATVNPDLTYNPLWASGDEAYPIAAPTWILVYKNQTDRAKGAALKAWLGFVLGDAQDMAEDLDYAKLPDALRDKAVAQIDQIVVPT
jgi:phosphate transport system substrate-binding protein